MPDGAAGRPARSVAATLDAVRTRTASAVAAALATWSTGLVDDEAIAIERAADELVLVHRLPEATRALHHAAMIAARSDEGEARRLTKLAIERIDDLDAEQWRRQLIAELRAEGIGLRPRRRAKRASTGWASLTASEEAVVALVGEGLTNTDRRAALRVAAYRRVASRPGLPRARAHHPAAARRSGGPPNRPISPRHKRSASDGTARRKVLHVEPFDIATHVAQTRTPTEVAESMAADASTAAVEVGAERPSGDAPRSAVCTNRQAVESATRRSHRSTSQSYRRVALQRCESPGERGDTRA